MLAKVNLRQLTRGRDLRVGDVIPFDGMPTAKALAHHIATSESNLAEVHSMEPWWVMTCKDNAERLAVRALKREGFEAYYPTYKLFRPTPRKQIASHMRHKKRHHVSMREVPLLPGYILLRRLFGDFDIYRLFDLLGCGGLCVETPIPDGVVVTLDDTSNLPEPRPVLVLDYKVEALRAACANGLYDVYHGVSAHSVYTGIVREAADAKVSHIRGKVIGRLDDSFKSSLFIDTGDRIVRVISSHEDAKAVGH